jgi:hypothetical protein
MQRTLIVGLIIALSACATRDAPPVDTAGAAPPVAATAAPATPVAELPRPQGAGADSVARLVVAILARRDIDALASLAHPTKGIRFTPYTHVDTTVDRRLLPAAMRAQWARADSVLWGSFDGSGDPMRLSFRQYFERFVHDFDAARAPRVARDSAPMGIGNSLYNLRDVYPAATIVEFNTPGTDPRYGGMDWRSLWIVLERVGADYRVVGIVHGSWTT